MLFLTFIFNFILLWRGGGGSVVGIMILLLFVGFMILLVIGFIVFLFKRKQKRIQNLLIFAAQNGWQSIPNANINNFQNPNYYPLLSSGRSREVNGLMQRQFGNEQVFLFDYQYTTGGGKNSKTYTQTVLAVHSPRLNLPYFSLYPESFLSFIGEAFGYNDIDFASHPHFSKRYKLTGKDEMFIRQMFHPQMLSYFDQLPTVNIDGGGNYIFVYELDKKAPIENLNWFIGERMKFVNLFIVETD